MKTIKYLLVMLALAFSFSSCVVRERGYWVPGHYNRGPYGRYWVPGHYN